MPNEEDDQYEETEITALIDIENFFHRRVTEGISLADIAIEALSPVLDDLPIQKGSRSLGNSSTLGGKYDGSIRNTGNFSAKGITVVDKLTTTGNSTVRDLLIVTEGSTQVGNVTMKSNVIFAGNSKLAGNITILENVISSGALSCSGSIFVKKRIISDGDLNLKGKITVSRIQSLASIKGRGSFFISKSLRAKSIYLQPKKGYVKGDVEAKYVGFGINRQLKRYISNFDTDKQLHNPLNLIKYIGRLIISPFIRLRSEPFEIEGDVLADEVFLENVIIHGDINARRITIGVNVEIRGELEYSEHLEILPEGKIYRSREIDASELLYIDLEESLGEKTGISTTEENTKPRDQVNKIDGSDVDSKSDQVL